MKSLRSLVPASEILSLSSKALLSSHRLFLIVLETFAFCMFYKYHIVFFCEVSLGLFLSTQGSPVRCSNKIFVVKYVSPFRTHNSFFSFFFFIFFFFVFLLTSSSYVQNAVSAHVVELSIEILSHCASLLCNLKTILVNINTFGKHKYLWSTLIG